MPRREAIAAAANDWLHRGAVDLAMARKAMRDPVDIDPWAVAFHAQQAAEKAIKAALVMEQVRIPRVHELERLSIR